MSKPIHHSAMSELMAAHGISVWLDPDWYASSHTPKWLAGQHIHAQAGRYYSTLTGSDPASIEAKNTASGHTPEEALMNVVRKITK